ncbi:MAG TPA: Stk1 family PASTA domain-containing Ser/Thr kinase [Pseudolysinimonas sp.]|nr:Stk1 family PASTA domain-containing Ser/Thr kinase [Pseudolysinimonas sp.]
MSVNTTDPMIGRLIDGRYQVRSRIARGGMATVYLATDLRLERRVAVKVMHGHLADDSQFKQRFIQEARSAARLAHPNVVNVFDQGQDADSAYLVMEYLPGITLRDLLQEYGSLTSQQTIDITEAVLSGLAAAHKAGIVHRDLKPENVLLADDGRIKIGDFGLARAASANTATGAALLGTIAYLSPELVTRGIADTRSDIYAVGIMMYEMLTGEQPFKGEQPMQIAYQHANDTVPTPSVKNPKVPAELDELVQWATEKDPEQRPRDARAMLDQLHETESQLRTALPSGATSSQRTVRMPAAVPLNGAAAETVAFARPSAPSGSDAETAIIAPQRARGAELSDSASALARVSQKRRGRGLAIFLVILVLAAAAGVTGWYFGLGPGSRVIIPSSIAGMSPADATTALKKLGLNVNPTPGEAFSPTVASGAVANTDPKIGTPVARNGAVQLLISKGPRPFPLPTLIGQSEKDATDLVSTHWKLGTVIRQFDAKVASGTVLDALDGEGKSLKGVAQYGDQQKISLVVSAGPLPSDLSGKSVDDAKAELAGAPYGMTVTGTVDVFSQTVPRGAVVGLVTTDSAGNAIAIRVGDKVQLQTSKGPEQVAVPDVVGMDWTTAKKTLTSAGFQIAFKSKDDQTLAATPIPSTVKSIDPGAGSVVDKGSTVTVSLKFH